MEEDDGFAPSDAEIDSEVEDSDLEGELGMWLDQLNTYSQEDSGAAIPKKPPPAQNRMTFTPKQVMDSFRCSILEGGDQEHDLDAILGELCQLETQLTTQQSEITTSIQNAESGADPSSKVQVSEAQVRDNKPTYKVKDRDSFAELQSALDDDLQSALSELSDLVGINFTSSPSGNSLSTQPLAPNEGQGRVTSPKSVQNVDLSVEIPDNKVGGASAHERFAGVNTPHGANTEVDAQFQDYSPDGADGDSAFSDSSSLPSSGSHVSVGTTSSQHSNGSGGSSGSSGIGVTANVSMDRMYGFYEMANIKEHLQQFQKMLEKQNLSPAEQATKLKAEKVRIALEKIKEANIQKLFVRFYSEDGCSKSILVDDKMTGGQVCERLVTKNNVKPSINWAVIECLPDLHMERLLEDHELLVEPLLMWTRDSNNRLLFVQSPCKYDVFIRPQVYLCADKSEEEYNDTARASLIEEYFSGENLRFPEIEGQLFLKSEGKKAWKKFFFVLRASGLYYSPKGKGKTSKDLVCLQKLDVVEVYTALSWKKKYKAPTEYGFALKHPQIQNKSPKYIKYLCADDQKTFSLWVTGIRIAKYRDLLLKNYKHAKKTFENWGMKEILPNQNFAEYLAKQNERNQEFAKEHQLRPRRSICQVSSQAMGDISETEDTDSRSIASSTSGHDPKGHTSSGSATTDIGLPVLHSSNVGNGSCRRSSFPLLDVEHRRPSTQSMDRCASPEYVGSDEDLRTPGKKTPILPVTTSTTRLLTDQNAASGTLKRRPSHGTLKKRVTTLLPPNNSTHDAPNSVACSAIDVDDLPPPPPELLDPPVDEVAYSVVNVAHANIRCSDTGSVRIGGSLPCSPQKRPPIYAKPQIPAELVGNGHLPQQSSFSAPQSPSPMSMHSPQSMQPPTHRPPQIPNYATPTHGSRPSVHRRVSSSPAPVQSSPEHQPHNAESPKRPPPPPKRSQNTKLSMHGDSPQTEYFITDLQRVLDQKHEWSQDMGPEPASFPPTPPPVKPRVRSKPPVVMDEWLPPPPAELLEGLQQARRQSRRPPPVQKKTFVAVPRGQH